MYDNKSEEELKRLSDDLIKKWNEKAELYKKNKSCKHVKEYKNLDASIKKVNTFIKKIRAFSDQNFVILMTDVKVLNLKRYMSEITSAVLELKFKIAHLPLLMKFLSKVHRRYKEFSSEYFSALHNKIDNNNDDKLIKPLVRLFCDSLFTGLAEDTDIEATFILHYLIELCEKDYKSEFSNCSNIAYLIKFYGDDLNIHSKESLKFYDRLNMDYKNIISSMLRNNLVNSLNEYYLEIKNFCQVVANKLHRLNKSFELYIGLHGDLTNEQKEKCKKLTDLNDKIQPAAKILAECLNMEFDIDIEEDEPSLPSTLEPIENIEENRVQDYRYYDEDEEHFYENLRDFSSIVPKATPKDIERVQNSLRDQYKQKKPQHISDDSDDDFDLNDFHNKSQTKNTNMEAFLTKMKNCINRDLIDNCSEEFLLYLNTKNNRKILVDNIFAVNRDHLDLLPFYARFLASLHPYTPDISLEISILLRKEFYYHIRRHHQFNLQSKIKACRFIGELVKFKIYSKADAINFIKCLLMHSQSYIVYMLCHLLESCGRFLNNSPESRPIMQDLLKQFTRKASLMNDEQHRIMIHNAILSCEYQEPRSNARNLDETPLLHRFIDHILFEHLNRHRITEVIDVLKKLPLHEKACFDHTVKCLSSPWKCKYSNIACVASLLFSIRSFAPNIDIFVVDGLLEEIQLGLELNISQYNQRLICMIKFFGEMYNYQIIEADTLLKTSFNLIMFGQSMRGFSNDPPHNLVRILMICELYKACGQFLIADPIFARFKDFFTMFQAYIWNKKLSDYFMKYEKTFPQSVDMSVKEMFEFLKIKKQLYRTPERVLSAVSDIAETKMENMGDVIQAFIDRGFNMQHLQIQDRVNNSQKESIKDSSSESVVDDDDVQFNRAYEQTLFESMNERGNERGTVTPGRSDTIDLSLPVNLKDRYIDSQDNLENQIKDKQSSSLSMLLLTKKNNKKCFKSVNIPKSEPLAVTVINKYNERKSEQMEVKRVILGMNKKT